ncbi:MAG: GNAT family N-acetyltransferase [Chloroflexi bacterium]|nr:MAG: GNAT family N-acetyltransferase [Chloroflexota bacterium]MBL1193384.1 GNAT family N-acetyltransferase [Chloroflexota bacterium]NOH10676.1 GNAT family N-acetyltransferase [Chloroflexota bacterium]
MSDISIRPAVAADLEYLVHMDHSYHTDFVWQMDMQNNEHQVGVTFRETRLPRSMRVEYPRDFSSLMDDWLKRSAVLVGENKDELVGYVGLMLGIAPKSTWVTDFVVLRRLRRQGYGSSLLAAAQSWAREQGSRRLVIEMQSKNYPGISMANKLGYEFCGYSDRYYTNQDIAIFFAKRIQT